MRMCDGPKRTQAMQKRGILIPPHSCERADWEAGAMSSAAYCLDSSVLVKILVPEEGSDVATAVLRQAIESGCRVIAPAFAWAEVGTTLRKKIKAGLITPAEAGTAWARFMSLDIEYLNDPVIREMAWLLS